MGKRYRARLRVALAKLAKDDWERALLHLPVGIIAGGLTIFHPAAGVALFAGILVYEAFNDWRKVDWSYKDVLGIVWGYGIGAIGTLGVLSLI